LHSGHPDVIRSRPLRPRQSWRKRLHAIKMSAILGGLASAHGPLFLSLCRVPSPSFGPDRVRYRLGVRTRDSQSWSTPVIRSFLRHLRLVALGCFWSDLVTSG